MSFHRFDLRSSGKPGRFAHGPQRLATRMSHVTLLVLALGTCSCGRRDSEQLVQASDQADPLAPDEMKAIVGVASRVPVGLCGSGPRGTVALHCAAGKVAFVRVDGDYSRGMKACVEEKFREAGWPRLPRGGTLVFTIFAPATTAADGGL